MVSAVGIENELMASKYPFKSRFNKKAVSNWAGQYPRDKRVRRTVLNEINLLDEVMPLNQRFLSGWCDALTLAAAKRADPARG